MGKYRMIKVIGGSRLGDDAWIILRKRWWGGWTNLNSDTDYYTDEKKANDIFNSLVDNSSRCVIVRDSLEEIKEKELKMAKEIIAKYDKQQLKEK